MRSPRVLVIEDADEVRELVGTALRRAGFEVATAVDGETGLPLVADAEPDVVVLDLGLPGMDGLEVCRRLRRDHPTVYVLVLTARGADGDTVTGLEAGADDYVVKPSAPSVLAARIRALLRRGRDAEVAAARQIGPLTVDVEAHEVTIQGQPLELTRIEFGLLEALTRVPGHVRSREELIEMVWGPGWVADGHLVEVHVSKLRRKLGNLSLIKTVRGVGYKAVPPPSR